MKIQVKFIIAKAICAKGEVVFAVVRVSQEHTVYC